MAALTALAAAARARCKAVVFGVTGSVGKTTTKEMLAQALAVYGGRVHATSGNLNNHYGVPLTLARMPADTAFSVIEMGMNHAGEITPLTRLAMPHHVAITAIAPAHLEFFDSVAAIARAKAEIFKAIPVPKSAVLPFDSEHYALLEQEAIAAGIGTIIPVGSHGGAAIRLQATEEEGNGRVTATVTVEGGASCDITFTHASRPLLLNSLTVLGLLHAAGLSWEPALPVLGDYQPGKGRGQVLVLPWQGGALTVIDDTYNASPLSMQEAIATLGRQQGRKVAVLGDMLELGAQSANYHRDLATPLHSHGVDAVYCVGAMMRHLFEALPETVRQLHTTASDAMAAQLPGVLAAGDVVLVKGSAGSRMNIVVQQLGKVS
jgi:UDP-N-acetylmuramoyl-tripeptide--D-alanyl-D-alanine ligase